MTDPVFCKRFRGIAGLKDAFGRLHNGFGRQSKPARSADQSIVAEVCPGRKRFHVKSVCPVRRVVARGLFLKTGRKKFLNELKRFACHHPAVTRICYRPAFIFVNEIFC
jgi:hypothetical protein